MMGNLNIMYILLKTTVAFTTLMVLARILGKKQMGQLTFFNYITGITIGSIAANIATLEEEHFFAELLNLVWWCILTILIDFITNKFPFWRVILDGQPTIIIKNGKIMKKAIKRLRMDLDNVKMLLREQGIFSIMDVDYAVIEMNGELTVYKKEESQQTIRKDFDLFPPPPKYIPTELILEGRVVKHNLKECGLTLEWLKEEIEKQDAQSIKDILYAEIQTDGTLYIDLDQNDKKLKKGDKVEKSKKKKK